MSSKKYDQDKLKWHLLPFNAVAEVVKVLNFGATKYGENNWQSLPNAKNRYFSAMLRHLSAWKSGSVDDSESGLRHMAHAACCALFILSFEVGLDPLIGEQVVQDANVQEPQHCDKCCGTGVVKCLDGPATCKKCRGYGTMEAVLACKLCIGHDQARSLILQLGAQQINIIRHVVKNPVKNGAILQVGGIEIFEAIFECYADGEAHSARELLPRLYNEHCPYCRENPGSCTPVIRMIPGTETMEVRHESRTVPSQHNKSDSDERAD